MSDTPKQQIPSSDSAPAEKTETKTEKKPKDDWKKIAEEKKLKKQRDQEMEKNKKVEKQATKQKADTPKEESKKEKTKEERAPGVEKEKEKEKEKQKQKADKPLDEPKRVPTTVEEILPARKVQFRTSEEDVKEILISYVPQLMNDGDSTLLGSTHQIIRDWSDQNVGEVIDIWGLIKNTRRENVIKTRFQDITYFGKTITKVLVGASAVFQNGAIMSTPGTLFLAVLAQEYNIPFIVLGSSHKYYDISVLEGDYSEYQGQIYDIIPAKYISLMVTEAGPINICSIETLAKQLHPTK